MALHDHVDEKSGPADLLKDVGGHARGVGEVGECDQGLRGVEQAVLDGQILHALEPADDVERARLWERAAGGLANGFVGGVVQPEGLVHGLHRCRAVGAGDEHGNLDLAGGDHVDVDLLGGEGGEHPAGHAFRVLHAHAHHRDLRHPVVVRHPLGADRLCDPLGPLQRVGEVVLGHGERDVGPAPLPHVLHDHVDGDAGLGEHGEERVAGARLVGCPFECDPGLVFGESDATHRPLHRLVCRVDQRAWDVLETRPHHHLHAELLGKLDRPRVHHAGPEARQFEHLVVGNRAQPPGLRQHPRVGGVDPVHVGVDLAEIGVEHRRERDGRGVGAAAAEGGDVAVLVDPLETGRDHHRPGIEQGFHMVG